MRIRFPALAFLTGLHFATLQFCYLMILQINISSTYVTYMVIVLTWLAGSLAGLWLKRLGGLAGIGLGLLGYYGVFGLVMSHPFSPVTLLLAVAGVGLAGLWAGRFFTAMLADFKSADRLFFHENNGFLIGIVCFFLGFTLTGEQFLLWVPGGLGLSLAGFQVWAERTRVFESG